MAQMVQGRHGGGSAVMGDKLYFAEGSGGPGGAPELSPTEVYAIEK